MIKLLSLLLFMLHAHSMDMTKTVVVRNKKGDLVKEKRVLKDLESRTHFEGKYFKIVLKTSNDPIKMDSSLVAKKAANTYFHLMQAREYFKKIGKEQIEKITIRIDIQNQYHKLFHFQNENLGPIFNNATTVKAGLGDMDFDIAPWGHEIWFRPAKKIKIDKSIVKQFKKTMRGNIPVRAAISPEILVYTGANALQAKDQSEALQGGLEEIFTNYLRNAAISLIVPEIASLFVKKTYFLDTAFIPEIIYHEYSHYIMADDLAPEVNNPLLEGFADYFASKIANSPLLAHELGKYGQLLIHRDAESREFYNASFDTEDGLGSDFVLSVLYELDQRISKYEDKNFFEKKMFDFRHILTVDSKIATDLPDYLWDELPTYNKLVIAILNSRGI